MTTELCPTCNKAKAVYYGSWCPRCEKPEAKTVTFLNLFQALHHIQAQGHSGYKDRMLEVMRDDCRFGNDIYLDFHFGDMIQEEDDPETGVNYYAFRQADLKLLKDTFDLGDQILLYISW